MVHLTKAGRDRGPILIYISAIVFSKCTQVMFNFLLRDVSKSYFNVLIELRLNPGLICETGP